MIRSEAIVETDLAEFGDVGSRVARCMAKGLGAFIARHGADPALALRTQRGIIWDYIAALLRDEFDNDPFVKIDEPDGTLYLRIGKDGQQKYSGRVKCLDVDMRPSNIPTRAMDGFLFQRFGSASRQPSLPFPDCDPDASGQVPITSLLFGYAADPGEWASATFHVVCPNGKSNAWMQPLAVSSNVTDFADAARRKMLEQAVEQQKVEERRFKPRGEVEADRKASEE